MARFSKGGPRLEGVRILDGGMEWIPSYEARGESVSDTRKREWRELPDRFNPSNRLYDPGQFYPRPPTAPGAPLYEPGRVYPMEGVPESGPAYRGPPSSPPTGQQPRKVAGQEGEDSLEGGTETDTLQAPSGAVVSVTAKTGIRGLEPRVLEAIKAMSEAAPAAGVVRIDVHAGREGGHKSHGSGTEIDLRGYTEDGSLWTPEQRVAVAAGARSIGADRFGLYTFGPGLGGTGVLHVGFSGAGRPAAMWGANGLTSGEASRRFSSPAEIAFLQGQDPGVVVASRGGAPAAEAVPDPRISPRQIATSMTAPPGTAAVSAPPPVTAADAINSIAATPATPTPPAATPFSEIEDDGPPPALDFGNETPRQLGPLYVQVQRGDTMWDLAQAHLGSGARWAEIAAANGNVQPKSLMPGMVLAIPGASPPDPTPRPGAAAAAPPEVAQPAAQTAPAERSVKSPNPQLVAGAAAPPLWDETHRGRAELEAEMRQREDAMRQRQAAPAEQPGRGPAERGAAPVPGVQAGRGPDERGVVPPTASVAQGPSFDERFETGPEFSKLEVDRDTGLPDWLWGPVEKSPPYQWLTDTLTGPDSFFGPNGPFAPTTAPAAIPGPGVLDFTGASRGGPPPAPPPTAQEVPTVQAPTPATPTPPSAKDQSRIDPSWPSQRQPASRLQSRKNAEAETGARDDSFLPIAPAVFETKTPKGTTNVRWATDPVTGGKTVRYEQGPFTVVSSGASSAMRWTTGAPPGQTTQLFDPGTSTWQGTPSTTAVGTPGPTVQTPVTQSNSGASIKPTQYQNPTTGSPGYVGNNGMLAGV